MTLAWWRDLMIVLAGATMTLAMLVGTILMIVIVIVLYKRVRRVLAVADKAIGNVDEVARLVKEEIVKPVVSIGALLRSIADFITSIKQWLMPRTPGPGGPPPAPAA